MSKPFSKLPYEEKKRILLSRWTEAGILNAAEGYSVAGLYMSEAAALLIDELNKKTKRAELLLVAQQIQGSISQIIKKHCQ